jgi:uncharacterized surface protein with fasciclin (FAS1) repeats
MGVVPMKGNLFAGVALAALAGLFASGHAPAPASDATSIYETLATMKEHTILYVGVKEADEIKTLKGTGPFTLFAPTDAAFKKLDDATIKTIATDKAAVKKLLRAHLVVGKFTAEDLSKLGGKNLSTLQNTVLKVEATKDGLRVGGAKLVTTDIPCSNGVIHVVDVVLPVAKE